MNVETNPVERKRADLARALIERDAQVRVLRSQGWKYRELAEKFDISISLVHYICRVKR